MKKCSQCGADYEIGDVVCARCDAELPDPYETDETEEGMTTATADGVTGVAQISREFTSPSGERWVEVALLPPPAVQAMVAELNWAGITHMLYPPAEAPNFGELLAQAGGVHLYVPDGHAAAAWQVLNRAALPPAEQLILSGAEVIVGDESFAPGTVIIGNGQILEILSFALPDPENGAGYLDISGMILTAGFTDIHTHGMLGIDVNVAESADFTRLRQAATAFGLTSLVPTTAACSPAELRRVLEAFRAAQADETPGARLLGMHLESNFISLQYAGAQPKELLYSPDDAQGKEICALLDEFAAEIAIITVAPEVPGVQALIPWLCERGITVSLGHSGATYEEAITAIDGGATMVTHLFNAMVPLNHRNPGLPGAALERDELFVEVVCDGIHVHPAVISAVISAKGAERFMPVSDSLRAAGQEEATFPFAGRTAYVEDGVARFDAKTIAGSVTTMDAIVRFMVERVGWNLHETLSMVAATPQQALGNELAGQMAVGAPADLVVLDQDLQVQMTLVNGTVVYRAE